MGPFKSILVPVDFGEATEPALGLALFLARTSDAHVTLVHAFDVTTFAGMTPLAPPVDVEPLFAEREREMHALHERARARWRHVTGVVRRGNAHESILAEAEMRHCDLIVIGSHGRRGLARLLLGSVAEKVVRLSPIPVLTVPPAAASVPRAGARDASAA